MAEHSDAGRDEAAEGERQPEVAANKPPPPAQWTADVTRGSLPDNQRPAPTAPTSPRPSPAIQPAYDRQRAFSTIAQQQAANKAGPDVSATYAAWSAQLPAGSKGSYLARLARLSQQSQASIVRSALLIAIPLGIIAATLWLIFATSFTMFESVFAWGATDTLSALMEMFIVLMPAVCIAVLPYFIILSIVRGIFNESYRKTYVTLTNTELPLLIADMHLYITSIEETPPYYVRWGKTEAGPGAVMESHLRLAAKFHEVLLSLSPNQPISRNRAFQQAHHNRFKLLYTACGLAFLSSCCTYSLFLVWLGIPIMAVGIVAIALSQHAVLAAICDYFRDQPDLKILGLKLPSEPDGQPPRVKPGLSRPMATTSRETPDQTNPADD